MAGCGKSSVVCKVVMDRAEQRMKGKKEGANAAAYTVHACAHCTAAATETHWRFHALTLQHRALILLCCVFAESSPLATHPQSNVSEVGSAA